jgi:hypothetical protein
VVCVELAARDRSPAAFLSDFGEGLGVSGKEVVGCLGVGFCHIAKGVDADFQGFR